MITVKPRTSTHHPAQWVRDCIPCQLLTTTLLRTLRIKIINKDTVFQKKLWAELAKGWVLGGKRGNNGNCNVNGTINEQFKN